MTTSTIENIQKSERSAYVPLNDFVKAGRQTNNFLEVISPYPSYAQARMHAGTTYMRLSSDDWMAKAERMPRKPIEYPKWMIGATMFAILAIACSIAFIAFALTERNQKATGAGFIAGALGFGALSELARRAEKLKPRP